jgi:hypothetical protein
MKEMNAAAVRSQHRRSRAEADRLVTEFERSGMKRTAFCLAHGVPTQTLDYYRRRQRGSGGRGSGSIMPVELVEGRAAVAAVPMDSRSALRVLLGGGRRIEVDAGFDASELKRLIATVEGV